MGVNGSISCSSCEVLSISIGNVFTSFRIAEPFGEAEVDNVDIMLLLPNADEEIVGLDVTVQEVAGMDKLNTLEHLIGQHKHRFEAELSLAIIEKIFQGWA